MIFELWRLRWSLFLVQMNVINKYLFLRQRNDDDDDDDDDDEEEDDKDDGDDDDDNDDDDVDDYEDEDEDGRVLLDHPSLDFELWRK